MPPPTSPFRGNVHASPPADPLDSQCIMHYTSLPQRPRRTWSSTHAFSLSLSRYVVSLSLSLNHFLSLTHSLTLSLFTLSLSHFLTLTLSHSLTLSLSLSRSHALSLAGRGDEGVLLRHVHALPCGGGRVRELFIDYTGSSRPAAPRARPAVRGGQRELFIDYTGTSLIGNSPPPYDHHRALGIVLL